MACLNPLRAIRAPSGEVIIKRKADLISLPSIGFDTDLKSVIDVVSGEVFEPFDVPCGKCLPCRLAYARKWAHRCLLESKMWRENWFLTFTYDDYSIHYNGDHQTLFVKDFQDFLKRLRWEYSEKYNHDGIRFYMAGEYGDTTFRPHYHMCGFNLPIGDLVYYAKSDIGDCYYNSATLNRIWGKGHVVIGELTEQSAAYTARYCQKKASTNIDYSAIGVEKEFVRMSRRPGIGAFYFQQNKEKIYENDKIYLPNGKTVAPSRYFDTLAEREGMDVEAIKSKRRYKAELLEEQRLNECSVEYWKSLEDLERSFQEKGRRLVRSI